MATSDGEILTFPVTDLYTTFDWTIAATAAHTHPRFTAIATSLPPINTTTSAIHSASTATESALSPAANATPCDWPGCWYDDAWTTPLTWMLFCYCFVSAFIMFSLWCGGYLDLKLNLADPYRGNPSRAQPTSTNEVWLYQQNQYRQRHRDRAAARRDTAAEFFEELQRRYSAVGIHVSIDELPALERERRDRIVVARLRQQGLM